METQKLVRCPTCRTLVTAQDEFFPFCSDRCRLIDLGKWASGAYRISSPVLDPEVLEGFDKGNERREDDDHGSN
ncbi:MAG: DNA gyrase inhibitor YacG [Silvibacterium sp.]